MRVTPSWIGVGDTSHAVRTVVRLRRVRRARERASWRALWATMVALALAALLALVREDLPAPVAWGAFAVALAFGLVAGWYGFAAPDGLGVEIGLEGGQSVEAPAANEAQLARLHAALERALDWHGGTPMGAPAATYAPPPSAAPPRPPPSPGPPDPASGPSADSDRGVVRVVDRDGGVIGEGPITIDASRPHPP